MLELRNLGAHPHSLRICTPVDSARVMRDVPELINHMWGQPLSRAACPPATTKNRKSPPGRPWQARADTQGKFVR